MPMRQRSKTNSRPGENLKLRASYARAHELCELGFWIPERFPAMVANETHHIMTGRRDCVTNLLRVSIPSHRWLEEFKTDGRIISLWIKNEKGELKPGEFFEASARLLPGWLSGAEVRNDFVRPYLEKLRRDFP